MQYKDALKWLIEKVSKTENNIETLNLAVIDLQHTVEQIDLGDGEEMVPRETAEHLKSQFDKLCNIVVTLLIEDGKTLAGQRELYEAMMQDPNIGNVEIDGVFPPPSQPAT